MSFCFRAQGCTERPGLDLAVFGDRWSGKSSLINAVRGLQTDDKGAAKVGQQEPCTQPVVYSFPRYSNVRIWELPPIRPNVQPEQYLKEVNGKDYEIIIIIASEIFKDHHGQLAKTLQDMGKKVLFVRNKIESDLAAYKRRHKSDYKESKFLKEIREFCVTCLCKEGVLKPTVYILSNLDIEKFQFQLLWSQIKNHPEMIKSLSDSLRKVPLEASSITLLGRGPPDYNLLWKTRTCPWALRLMWEFVPGSPSR
eukprot:g28492.t1